MEEIGTIKYKRAINLDITTVDTRVASKDIVCAAFHARFQRKCGSFSSQPVFARFKFIPSGTTQPRAELTAATLILEKLLEEKLENFINLLLR